MASTIPSVLAVLILCLCTCCIAVTSIPGVHSEQGKGQHDGRVIVEFGGLRFPGRRVEQNPHTHGHSHSHGHIRHSLSASLMPTVPKWPWSIFAQPLPVRHHGNHVTPPTDGPWSPLTLALLHQFWSPMVSEWNNFIATTKAFKSKLGRKHATFFPFPSTPRAERTRFNEKIKIYEGPIVKTAGHKKNGNHGNIRVVGLAIKISRPRPRNSSSDDVTQRGMGRHAFLHPFVSVWKWSSTNKRRHGTGKPSTRDDISHSGRHRQQAWQSGRRHDHGHTIHIHTERQQPAASLDVPPVLMGREEGPGERESEEKAQSHVIHMNEEPSVRGDKITADYGNKNKDNDMMMKVGGSVKDFKKILESFSPMDGWHGSENNKRVHSSKSPKDAAGSDQQEIDIGSAVHHGFHDLLKDFKKEAKKTLKTVRKLAMLDLRNDMKEAHGIAFPHESLPKPAINDNSNDASPKTDGGVDKSTSPDRENTLKDDQGERTSHKLDKKNDNNHPTNHAHSHPKAGVSGHRLEAGEEKKSDLTQARKQHPHRRIEPVVEYLSNGNKRDHDLDKQDIVLTQTLNHNLKSSEKESVDKHLPLVPVDGSYKNKVQSSTPGKDEDEKAAAAISSGKENTDLIKKFKDVVEKNTFEEERKHKPRTQVSLKDPRELIDETAKRVEKNEGRQEADIDVPPVFRGKRSAVSNDGSSTSKKSKPSNNHSGGSALSATLISSNGTGAITKKDQIDLNSIRKNLKSTFKNHPFIIIVPNNSQFSKKHRKSKTKKEKKKTEASGKTIIVPGQKKTTEEHRVVPHGYGKNPFWKTFFSSHSTKNTSQIQQKTPGRVEPHHKSHKTHHVVLGVITLVLLLGVLLSIVCAINLSSDSGTRLQRTDSRTAIYMPHDFY